MNNIYTFLLYLVVYTFSDKIICFELDIGQVLDYSRANFTISVLNTREFQNLYTHQFDGPKTLKEIYNGGERLYFDPSLVNDQLLLSASVVWSHKTPSVVQLNLEKSSVLLLNEYDSSLSVQAIFSETVVSNITPRIHSSYEPLVDIDFSKLEDYDSNSSKVYVTKLESPDSRFQRFTIRNYNLESTKLGKLLYNEEELKSIIETEAETETEKVGEEPKDTEKPKQKIKTEEILSIPSKNDVYSVLVYSYNDFPLLIEILYTFNKRAFYGFEPEKKWHHVYFPTFQDPTFLDFLYKHLNYYGCKNGFKYTIDVSINTYTVGDFYSIDNYCMLPNGVETISNRLKVPFYTDGYYRHGRYRCFEHIPSNDTKFFLDHLMVGSSVLQLPNVPNVIKCVRVYRHLDLRPYLIVFVDKSDVLHYYTYEDKAWKRDKTVSDVPFGDRFTDNIRTLLDELVDEDKRQGKRAHKLVIDEESISYMSETVRILSKVDSEYVIDTYKKDRSSKQNNKLKVKEFDLWWYSYYSDTTKISGFGLLKNVLFARTLPNCAMRPVKYYGYNIYNFDEGIYVHRIDYFYEEATRDMTVYLYTNALFIYVFRKNYREASDINWKFITVEPMKVLEKYDSYTKYFSRMKELNKFNYNVSEIVANPVNLLPDTVRIKFSKIEFREIDTIKRDNAYNDLKKGEYDLFNYKTENELATSEGDPDTTATILTKPRCGINHVKYQGQTVKLFKDDRTLVHLIKYTFDNVWYNIKIELFTNTLYHFTYTRNEKLRIDENWIFVSKKPVNISRTKEIEKYFQITNKFDNFNFG